ncbi:MAG: type II toxin-antitoxin system HicB family antitoxin [Mesorhizobium sp.]|nr:type II toxin-antitoxin system HicB family antitoxin [Mesorhizobium sp.]
MAADQSDTLQLRVPPTLKRKLAMDAAEQGVTIRTLILNALVTAGYDVPQEEIRDKRKVRQ